MALIPRLELHQRQSLVMTPQLQKAIKLLQFSNIELREFVEGEVADNPLLELNDNDPLPDNQMNEEHGAKAPVEESYSEDSDGLETLDLQRVEHVSEDQVNDLDIVELGNIWEQDSAQTPMHGDVPQSLDWRSVNRNDIYFTDGTLEQTLSQETTLRDYLINQIQVELHDPKDRMIATYLTDHLDERGRLPYTVEKLAARIGCSKTKMDQVLKRIQTLDPPGIFARNLTECWAIQLRDLNRLDPAMETLLENIEILKNHDYETLALLCHVDQDDIKDMINELWALTHNPSESFDQIIAQPITPDLTMRPGSEGSWIVELNTSELPKVLVNNSYYAEISNKMRNKDEKQYIIDKLQWANWFVKSLHQRAITILKVATEIVSQQDKFFELGVEYLKPLGLRDIADEIEMHESTVSRVTTNKYIDTPRGIFELKYFFTTAISSSKGGDDYSAEAVRHKIRTLIENEPSDSILSDDKLVELLNSQGIEIARRTVAKYRDAMNIPSSIHRRKLRSGSPIVN